MEDGVGVVVDGNVYVEGPALFGSRFGDVEVASAGFEWWRRRGRGGSGSRLRCWVSAHINACGADFTGVGRGLVGTNGCTKLGDLTVIASTSRWE